MLYEVITKCAQRNDAGQAGGFRTQPDQFGHGRGVDDGDSVRRTAQGP